MPLVDALSLRELCSRLFEGVGVNLRDATFTASALVASDLRGVDSHGVALLRYYLEQLEQGDMEAHGDPEVLHNSGCTALVDGHNAIGQLVARFCCDQAIALAIDHGCDTACSVFLRVRLQRDQFPPMAAGQSQKDWVRKLSNSCLYACRWHCKAGGRVRFLYC